MDTNTHLKMLIGYHNHLCADGIKSILKDQEEDTMIDTAKNGRSILNVLKSKNYNLLIIQLIYPGCDTYNYLSELRKSFKALKILLISDLIQNGMLVDIVNSGIDGYILHTCSGDDLKIAVKKLMNDEHYICTTVTTQILLNKVETENKFQNIQITSREKEVLSHLVKMHSNKQIAEKLNISELTVKTHRKNIMKKFGSRNLISLVRYACRENLINGEDDEFCKGCPHRFRFNYN